MEKSKGFNILRFNAKIIFLLTIILLSTTAFAEIQTNVLSEKHDLISHEVILEMKNNAVLDTLKSWDLNLIGLNNRGVTNLRFYQQNTQAVPIYETISTNNNCPFANRESTQDKNSDWVTKCYSTAVSKLQAQQPLYTCQVSDSNTEQALCYETDVKTYQSGTKNVVSWNLLGASTTNIAGTKLIATLPSVLLKKQKTTIVKITWDVPLKSTEWGSNGQWSLNPSSWWDSTWLYRKKINLQGETGADANYQIKFNFMYGAGTDTNNTIFLNSLSRTDFNDLRFTNSESLSIDYWIETKTDSLSAKIWVEVDANLDLNQSIYVYYGNENQTTHDSNGFATFILFDDFEDGDITDWTEVEATGDEYSVTNGELIVNHITRNENSYMAKAIPTVSTGFRTLITTYLDAQYLSNANFCYASITESQGTCEPINANGDAVNLRDSDTDANPNMFLSSDNGSSTGYNGTEYSGSIDTYYYHEFFYDQADNNAGNLIWSDQHKSNLLAHYQGTGNSVASLDNIILGSALQGGSSADWSDLKLDSVAVARFVSKEPRVLSTSGVELSLFQVGVYELGSNDKNIAGTYKIDFNIFSDTSGYNNTSDYDFNIYYSTTQGLKENAVVTDSNLATTGNCSDTNVELTPNCYYEWDTTSILDLSNVYLILSLFTADGNFVDTNYTNFFKIDNNEPDVSIDVTPNDWNQQRITATISTSDIGTGVLDTNYRLDTDPTSTINYGAWATYTTGIQLPADDGNYYLDVNSWDYNLNFNNTQFELLQDLNDPVIESTDPSSNTTGSNSTYTFTFTMQDSNGADANYARIIIFDADTNDILTDTNEICSGNVCSKLVSFANGQTRLAQGTIYDFSGRFSSDTNTGTFTRDDTTPPVVQPSGGGGGGGGTTVIVQQNIDFNFNPLRFDQIWVYLPFTRDVNRVREFEFLVNQEVVDCFTDAGFECQVEDSVKMVVTAYFDDDSVGFADKIVSFNVFGKNAEGLVGSTTIDLSIYNLGAYVPVEQPISKDFLPILTENDFIFKVSGEQIIGLRLIAITLITIIIALGAIGWHYFRGRNN